MLFSLLMLWTYDLLCNSYHLTNLSEHRKSHAIYHYHLERLESQSYLASTITSCFDVHRKQNAPVLNYSIASLIR